MLLQPFLRGSNIRRYSLQRPELCIFFPYRLEGTSTVYYPLKEIAQRFPLAWEYLSYAKAEMSGRGSARMRYPIWYALWNPRDLRLLTSPKVLVPTIANKPSFAFDATGQYFFLGSGAGGPGAYGLVFTANSHSYFYTLGLLNSRITHIFIQATSSIFRGGYRAYSQQFLWEIPFRPIDFSDPKEVARHDRMVELVKRMLELHERLADAKIGRERTIMQQQIDATDRLINQLVYELYGLTAEEIAIIEAEVA